MYYVYIRHEYARSLEKLAPLVKSKSIPSAFLGSAQNAASLFTALDSGTKYTRSKGEIDLASKLAQ